MHTKSLTESLTTLLMSAHLIRRAHARALCSSTVRPFHPSVLLLCCSLSCKSANFFI